MAEKKIHKYTNRSTFKWIDPKKVITPGNLLMKFVPLRYVCDWKEIEAIFLQSHSTPSIQIAVFNKTIRRISKLHLVLFSFHRLRSTSSKFVSSKVPTRIMNTDPDAKQHLWFHQRRRNHLSQWWRKNNRHRSTPHWGGFAFLSLASRSICWWNSARRKKIKSHNTHNEKQAFWWSIFKIYDVAGFQYYAAFVKLSR